MALEGLSAKRRGMVGYGIEQWEVEELNMKRVDPVFDNHPDVVAQRQRAEKFIERFQIEQEQNGSARERFEAIIASLNYDGLDTDSLTVGEIRRSLP